MVVYLDDIIVDNKTLQEHIKHLRKVFKELTDNELYIKKKKCSFAQPKASFLGHKIKDDKLMMEGIKVKAIKDWVAHQGI